RGLPAGRCASPGGAPPDRLELWRLPDDQRSRAPGRPLSGRARARGQAAGARGAGPRRCGGQRGRPGDVHARRHRLGRRGPPGHGRARRLLTGRPHRHGGVAALRRSGDPGDEDPRAPLRVAELDLPAPECRGPAGRAPGVRKRPAGRVRSEESVMATADYLERIPNNVDLTDNRRLLRALEDWQPKFLEWWHEMGPDGFQARDVYLRTAVSVDPQGW